LEEEICQFLGCRAALLYNTGYAANTGVIPVLCGEEDLILSDSLNHASIVDGCRLSRAKKKIYKHCDLNELENILKVSGKHKNTWIVTESVFSMDGDIAPLPKIVELSNRYGAHVYLDEAHAVGVLGDRGRGCASHFRVEEEITVRMGTLGKALGSFGAFVAGDRDIIDLLVNRSRSLIYSTALPPPVVAASRAALDLVQGAEGEQLRERLFSNARRLAHGLTSAGFDGVKAQTPILPVVLGPVQKTLDVSRALYEGGVFAPAIRPPTVPQGTARIRFSVMAPHTEEDLDKAVSVMRNL
jgi:glycine C-acetyltransferase